MQKYQKNIINFVKRKPSLLFTNILITEHCTQRCMQCSIPDRERECKVMRFEEFQTILNKISNYGTQFITLSGGEPMLHPELERFIAETQKFDFKNVHVLSSLYGPDSSVDKLIDLVFKHNLSISCSFDGFGEIADKLRGRKNVSEIVSKNMSKINEQNSKLEKKIVTGVNVVISNKNLYQIPDILEYTKHMNWATNVDLYRWASDNHNEHDEMKIKDFDKLNQVIELAKSSEIVKTPNWLLDGYLDYYKGDFEKMCPYTDSPTFGSKFFIQVNGDVEVCLGGSVGNLIETDPKDIFTSKIWQDYIDSFKTCNGCWNSCYTLSSRVSNFINKEELTKLLTTLSKLKK
jgi:MoaA/NifB/PqqE/SkfB family radical SAM enzyme